MSMNVKVGQTWRHFDGHEWIVKAMITDGEEAGRWQCECTVGTQRHAVGSVKVWPLKLPRMWTLVRDVEPQVPQVGEVWEYDERAVGHQRGERLTVRALVHGTDEIMFEEKIGSGHRTAHREWFVARARRVAPAAPATKSTKPQAIELQPGESLALPPGPIRIEGNVFLPAPGIDEDMRRRNDEFHERHKERLKVALASLGSEGFTVRVPSRSWER